jgi:glycosyltransferase involved in cell wall biosynthesis
LKSKRIAIIANTSWNIYNFRLGLIQFLIHHGYEVHVIAPLDEYTDKIKSFGIHFHRWLLLQKSTNPIYEFVSIIHLSKILKVLKIDYSLNFTIKPNLYATFLSIILDYKCINNVTGLGTMFIRQSFIFTLIRKLYAVIFNHSYHVFFQNESDMEFFISNKWITPYKASLLPGSGVDLARFKPYEKKSSESKDEINFIMIARLLYDKGIIEYLESAKSIILKYGNSKAKFHLMGKLETKKGLGIAEAQLQSYINENIITYHGFCENPELVMKDMDVLVLPSYREGMSKVLLEALAMGLPIITTNVPGCKECVAENQNGFLVEPRSIDSLIRGIERMIALESQVRKKFGETSRKLAEEKFSDKIVYNAYIKIISK